MDGRIIRQYAETGDREEKETTTTTTTTTYMHAICIPSVTLEEKLT
jgi:hypothetical protein